MTTIPNDWLESSDLFQTPFVYPSGAANPFSEGAMLQAYIALARLCEALGWMKEDGHPVDADDLDAIGLAISFTLEAISATGLTTRHPELAQMPLEVAPSKFLLEEGDNPEQQNNRLTEWISDRLEAVYEIEKTKLNANWN